MPKLVEIELDRLINVLVKSNPLMDMHTIAIKQGITWHRSPVPLVKALIFFQETGLFSGESAEANFKKAIRFIRPKEMAEAMSIFLSTPSSTGEVVQAYFNHIIRHDNTWFTDQFSEPVYDSTGLLLSYNKRNEWLNIAITFKCLYFKSDLLIGPNARLNFDSLLTFCIPSINTVLSYLHCSTDLLVGPYAQSNFNLLISHQAPEYLADALPLLIFCTSHSDEAGLFSGRSAQANFEALLSKPNLAGTLPFLEYVFNQELDASQAQALFDEHVSRSTAPRGRTQAGDLLKMGLFSEKSAHRELPMVVGKVSRPGGSSALKL